MKLLEFSISRYRNIRSAKFRIGDYTVLLGPNNQGKTTVFKALELAFQVLEYPESRAVFARKIGPYYSFENDYPKNLAYADSRPTEFLLCFKLSDDERKRFQAETKLFNNGELAINISFKPKNNAGRFAPVITIQGKKGKGATNYQRAANQIATFISRFCHRAFIPIIRTEDEAKAALQNLVAMNLQHLSQDEEYLSCLQKMRQMEKEAVNTANGTIKSALEEFLPDIRGVRISYDPPNDILRTSRDYFDIYIDDEVDTALQMKGSGVASLAVIALIQNKLSGDALIIIEEPECHLHADAIHAIANRLKTADQGNQIIISTHNPSFVPTSRLDCVYCVRKGVWSNPRSLFEIRKSLGLSNADSMYWPEKVIIVEGDDDRKSLEHIIYWLSPNGLGALLKKEELLIASCGGASKIVHFAAFYANALVNFLAFCDGDQAGKATAQKITRIAGPNSGAITIGRMSSKIETELEDILPANVVCGVLRDRGIGSNEQEFLGFKGRFHKYLSMASSRAGVFLDETQELDLKASISEEFSKRKCTETDFDPNQLAEWRRIIREMETAMGVADEEERFDQISIFGDPDF